jgi:hypothetical protein
MDHGGLMASVVLDETVPRIIARSRDGNFPLPMSALGPLSDQIGGRIVARLLVRCSYMS